MEWIEVKTKLPDEDCKCLAYTALYGILICWQYGGTWKTEMIGSRDIGLTYKGIVNVSHWMPLPALP